MSLTVEQPVPTKVQKRRSVSLRGSTYWRLREFAVAKGDSTSNIVEDLIGRLLGGSPIVDAPTPPPPPSEPPPVRPRATVATSAPTAAARNKGAMATLAVARDTRTHTAVSRGPVLKRRPLAANGRISPVVERARDAAAKVGVRTVTAQWEAEQSKPRVIGRPAPKPAAGVRTRDGDGNVRSF